MRKTLRVSFGGGVNIVADKSLIPEGYADCLDNVDLRSGSVRCIKEPLRKSNLAPGSSDTKLFTYRGKWIFSQKWRDYVAEHIAGIDRIYWTEEGAKPQLLIEGKQADLGTIVPLASPVVVPSNTLVPVIKTITATVETGRMSPGTYAYRVAAKTADGITYPASPSQKITWNATVLANDSRYVTITWTSVVGAKYYLVYGRTEGEERLLATLPSSLTEYKDYGTDVPSGGFAEEFSENRPTTYTYSYLRNINGVTDEGGLSPLSVTITANNGRLVTRDTVNDGFYDQPNAQKAIVINNMTTSWTNYASIVITAASYSSVFNETTFTTQSAHQLVTGDVVAFTAGTNVDAGGTRTAWTDPKYDFKSFEVVVVPGDTTHFTIKGIGLPTDTIPTSSPYKAVERGRIRVVLNSSPSYTAPVDGDALRAYVQPSSTNAKKINNEVFSVYTKKPDGSALPANAYELNGFWWAYDYSFGVPTGRMDPGASITSSNATWVPGNGGITHWNLYRTSDSGAILRVEQVVITSGSYTDSKPQAYLGDTPDSQYIQDGIPVSFAMPPPGMTNLIIHYGMLFGVSGNTIRWTPIGKPNAWPSVFAIEMPFRPLALASFAGALVILCTDGIYRLDGNTPTQLSLMRTPAERGCVAPYSVQKTLSGLIYLSNIGLMVFDGMHARCITDQKVPGKMIIGPSLLSPDVGFWWLPTTKTYLYANQTAQDGVPGVSMASPSIIGTNPIPWPIYEIRSFYFNGKYFLFWAGRNHYQAHTCLVVDTQMEGFPVTTMSMKLMDVVVDETGSAFALADYSPSGDTDMAKYLIEQAKLTPVDTFSGVTSNRSVWELFAGQRNIPMRVRTGRMSIGNPTENKKFKYIEFYGAGTLQVRVFIDGSEVVTATLDEIEKPLKPRKIGIPLSKGRSGYVLDVEFVGDIAHAAMEVTYEDSTRGS